MAEHDCFWINCPWFDTQGQTELLSQVSLPLVSVIGPAWLTCPSGTPPSHPPTSLHQSAVFWGGWCLLCNHIWGRFSPPLTPVFLVSLQVYIPRVLPSEPSARSFSMTSVSISNLTHSPCTLWAPTENLESALRAVVAHLSGKCSPGDQWSSRHHFQLEPVWGWGFPGKKLGAGT